MNCLSNKVSIEGYFSKCDVEGEMALLQMPLMTKTGVVVCKALCKNEMLTRISVTERTRIMLDGRMIGGVIHVNNVLRLN